jgi:hypothetical protein
VRAGALAVLGTLAAAQALAQRTDVVTMTNGDRVTGEIQKLSGALLQLKTDHVGTIEFEWPSVESLESRDSFEVVLDDGRRLYGTLHAASGRRLEVRGALVDTVGLRSVVEIAPLERSFWQQLSGSLSLGFSFSQSNDTTTFTLSADAQYLTRRWVFGATASSYLDAQRGADTSTRNMLGFTLGRVLARRWRVLELNEAFQSDQLGIRLRTTFGLAAEHDVVHTNRNLLSPTAGLVYSATAYDGDTPTRDEALLLLGTHYSFITFGQHKTNFDTSFHVLPSLTDWGHVRLDWSARFRVKLFHDFYWSLDFYENYDNHPPPSGYENDFGGSASLAWSF